MTVMQRGRRKPSCTTAPQSAASDWNHASTRTPHMSTSLMPAFATDDGNQDTQTLLSPITATASHDAPPYITKNLSTSNLLSHASSASQSPTLNVNTNVRTRYSLDANTAMEFASMSKYVLSDYVVKRSCFKKRM